MASDPSTNSNRNDDREPQTASAPGDFHEEAIWNELRTVYDPEIPVNIVDLGLIYSVKTSLAQPGHRIDVRMSLTAPGCSMSEILKAEVERKLLQLPGVAEVQVEVVFDPPWHPGMMSEAAKFQLGFDADYGAPAQGRSSFDIIR